MAKAKEPTPPLGRLCPLCGAALKVSKTGWTYCPNKYDKKPPCTFKGAKAFGAAVVVGAGEDIKPLETASDEQKAIFAFAEGK